MNVGRTEMGLVVEGLTSHELGVFGIWGGGKLAGSVEVRKISFS